MQARERLLKAAEASPNDVAALRAFAEFEDRHRDPAARDIYNKLDAALERTHAPREQREMVARRLAILDLLAGDQKSAARHVEAYQAEGGTGFAMPGSPAATLSNAPNYIEIPGPLRSFARMAALSPDLRADDLLPAMARNVVTNGYRAGPSNEGLEQTEYLSLVLRYLTQARELEHFRGSR